jgi:hypothetical protein
MLTSCPRSALLRRAIKVPFGADYSASRLPRCTALHVKGKQRSVDIMTADKLKNNQQQEETQGITGRLSIMAMVRADEGFPPRAPFNALPNWGTRERQSVLCTRRGVSHCRK